LESGSPAIHFNVARAIAKDRPGEAITHLQQAIKVSTNFAMAHRALGELFLQTDQHGNAERCFRTCQRLASDDVARAEILSLIERCQAEQP